MANVRWAVLALGLVITPVTAKPRVSAPAPVPALRVAGEQRTLVAGFYSGGLGQSLCYGSCAAGSKGARDEAAARAQMTELEKLHVRFVANNETVVHWYHSAPASFLAYLADLHAHGIQVSYSIASGPKNWFVNGAFDPAGAQALFAQTDLDHDGISDLDGRLDVLYQGHEVLEWTTHEQRTQIYTVAKKWFPHTPVSVYYAGFARPFDPRWSATRHPRGGTWADYAYGPGEADIVHLGIRRNASGTTIDGGTSRPTWNPAAFHDEVSREVALVEQLTPGTPVYISTSFAGDTQMRKAPASMWAPEQISQWWAAAVSVPGVSGLLLRSYGRFAYDLGAPDFGAQRAAWTALASTVSPS